MSPRRGPILLSAVISVDGNHRLTALVGVVGLVPLLLVEGLTIISLGPLLPVHLFVGFWLLPPLLLKVGSTGYRFAAYYLRRPAFRAAGPPDPVARVVGPVVVATTLLLMASGVALWLGWGSRETAWGTLHRAGFVAWFLATTVHFLIHILPGARLSLADLRSGPGRGTRTGLLAGCLLAGLLVALASLLYPSPARFGLLGDG